jgi:uncharacterized protein YhaN
MRIHRITLRNWRGVAERETRFAASGVTVVEGPNETGKSSLFEALDALLKYYDDSKKGALLAAKPVHLDAGPEVEAELESGPYRFVYGKRFLRKPATQLEILSPSHQTLTGRQAHERVLAMLEETLDFDLWSALRVQQGQGITQAKLADKKALAAALDRAAGVARTGEAEESLFAAAEQEYQRYFTPGTGARRKDFSDAEAQVARLTEQLASEQQALDELTRDVDRSATLAREVLSAKQALDAAKQQHEVHAAKLRELERAEDTARQAGSAYEGAQREADRAKRAVEQRTLLAQAARQSASKHAALLAQADETLPALQQAQAELHDADVKLEAAQRAVASAERRHDVAAQDFEFRKYELDLQQLGERKDRIDGALAKAHGAQAVLAVNRVSDDALDAVRKAHLELEKAKAALQAGSPVLQVRALSDLALEVNGAAQPMAAGEARSWAASGVSAWVLPGTLELQVTAGGSLANVHAAAVAREQQYAAACRQAGVEDLDAAVAANAAWKTAQADVAARDEKVKENLRDLTLEQLDRKLEGLTARVGAYLAARSADFDVAPDFDAARDAASAEKAALSEAKTASGDAERRRKGAHAELERLREVRREGDLQREGAKVAAELAAASLKAARGTEDDDALVRSAEQAAVDSERLAKAYRALAEGLTRSNPVQVRMLADNAASVYATAGTRLRALQDEQLQVQTRLRASGEEGLSERRDATATKLEQASNELARAQVHAAAAKLLFSTLQTARDQSRRAYVAPLRDKLAELGRLLYGASFGVELDDELQITHRTLDGRTLPYESLSGGAKEQLGVLARVACALLVSGDGGVPVLIDDALGYSDAERLQTLGAVLGLAGRHCQILVLTCFPDRYRHIGNATVVKA